VFEETSRQNWQMTVDAFVYNVQSFTQYPEHPQSRSSALSLINEPTNLAPDLTIFMFVGIASLMIIISISYLNADVFLQ
jgi:hypothetical protein